MLKSRKALLSRLKSKKTFTKSNPLSLINNHFKIDIILLKLLTKSDYDNISDSINTDLLKVLNKFDYLRMNRLLYFSHIPCDKIYNEFIEVKTFNNSFNSELCIKLSCSNYNYKVQESILNILETYDISNLYKGLREYVNSYYITNIIKWKNKIINNLK